MKLEVKNDIYYINGKEVRDPLEFTIKERGYIKYFKQMSAVTRLKLFIFIE